MCYSTGHDLTFCSIICDSCSTFSFPLIYYSFPSYIIITLLSYFSLTIHTNQKRKRIVIYLLCQPLLLQQMRWTCQVLRNLLIWFPKIRFLCLTHNLLILNQNPRDMLIPQSLKNASGGPALIVRNVFKIPLFSSNFFQLLNL